jgi:formylglycine-generating enzyme required for sulfatase activity
VAERSDSAPGGGAKGEIIRPVAYRPQEETLAGRLRVTPLHAVLAGAGLAVAVVLWFLFTAKSVRLEFDPPEATANVSRGIGLPVGEVWLLRPGEYLLHARAGGHYPLETTLVVGTARNQSHRFELVRLPGRVSFESDPPGAEVVLDGQIIGTTPTEAMPIPAGSVRVEFAKPRYQARVTDADIVGMDQPQTVHGELQPDWADVTISSRPEGAEIFVDDEPTGQVTPAVVEVLAGEREIRLRVPGHKSHRQRILVAALEQVTLPEARLERADGVLVVRTTPGGAGITLNGQYQGESPLEIAVQSGVNYRVQAFSAGYATAVSNVRLAAGGQRTLNLALERLTGRLVVRSQPQEAELVVNGRPAGTANQTLELPTGRQEIEVRAPGYASYKAVITTREGVPQELRVRLLTVEEARLAALTPVVTTAAGQELVLMSPSAFTMGSSRRQPGRRANETLREVNLTRLYYIGRHEVTNAQFRKFAPGHDSGSFHDHTLNGDDQPVVNVSWDEAALYCNWLSQQDGLEPFYRTEFGKVTGVNPGARGYRLPTEAEWAWAARQVRLADGEELRFPWGTNLPPPDRHGNYADHSASHLVGRIIFGYNDNYIVSAPVGTFPANAAGLHDLSGNVAEWINDYYEIPSPEPVTDPTGPERGEHRVIRGSSWMHGTVTELRLPFRDYGNAGRPDLGFRIARFAEGT